MIYMTDLLWELSGIIPISQSTCHWVRDWEMLAKAQHCILIIRRKIKLCFSFISKIIIYALLLRLVG